MVIAWMVLGLGRRLEAILVDPAERAKAICCPFIALMGPDYEPGSGSIYGQTGFGSLLLPSYPELSPSCSQRFGSVALSATTRTEESDIFWGGQGQVKMVLMKITIGGVKNLGSWPSATSQPTSQPASPFVRYV